MKQLKRLLKPLLDSGRDLLPILIVIAAFQLLILHQPLPDAGNLLPQAPPRSSPFVYLLPPRKKDAGQVLDLPRTHFRKPD